MNRGKIIVLKTFKTPIYWNKNIKAIIGANNFVKLTRVCEMISFFKLIAPFSDIAYRFIK